MRTIERNSHLAVGAVVPSLAAIVISEESLRPTDCQIKARQVTHAHDVYLVGVALRAPINYKQLLSRKGPRSTLCKQ
jgi:hypothetical protein